MHVQSFHWSLTWKERNEVYAPYLLCVDLVRTLFYICLQHLIDQLH